MAHELDIPEYLRISAARIEALRAAKGLESFYD